MHRVGVETLLAEFDDEMVNTRRILERVPEIKLEAAGEGIELGKTGKPYCIYPNPSVSAD